MAGDIDPAQGSRMAYPARMGLMIYNDEIIDELQRRYLPEEFRDLRYVGAAVCSIAPRRLGASLKTSCVA